jgi:hypothetical protein
MAMESDAKRARARVRAKRMGELTKCWKESFRRLEVQRCDELMSSRLPAVMSAWIAIAPGRSVHQPT